MSVRRLLAALNDFSANSIQIIYPHVPDFFLGLKAYLVCFKQLRLHNKTKPFPSSQESSRRKSSAHSVARFMNGTWSCPDVHLLALGPQMTLGAAFSHSFAARAACYTAPNSFIYTCPLQRNGPCLNWKHLFLTD